MELRGGVATGRVANYDGGWWRCWNPNRQCCNQGVRERDERLSFEQPRRAATAIAPASCDVDGPVELRRRAAWANCEGAAVGGG